LKEEVKILVKLQAIDQWLSYAENLRREIPKKIQEQERTLEDAKKMAKDKENALKEMELERREKERELQFLGEKIGEKKGKLFQVKSNEEYAALLKEIELMKEQVSNLEDEIILLLDKIEEVQKELQDAKRYSKEKEKELEEARKKGDEEIADLEQEIKEKKEQREKLAESLDQKIYQIYERVRKNRGYAIAKAENYTCLGCHMEIPPQTFVEVRKGEQLVQCPFCSRILYFWEETKEE